ncbi:helix-turn-helix domain-containing protein [Planktotalea sp.]|uniref:helix-turn-helix domain-containing protein n=1 Tax=Planktotalea sp. TaxID=2029877 RepID=UPI003D6C311A
MSVNEVFGQNLRLLCSKRESIASVARDLGIGKVQFHRYIASQSFPKPNVLEKICEYFKVDARIVLEPLHFGPDGAPALPREERATLIQGDLVQAFGVVTKGHQFFRDQDDFPDGMYANWRNSLSNPGSYVVTLLQLTTQGTSRIMRGFDAKQMLPKEVRVKPREREYKGILMQHGAGYSAVFFSWTPDARTTSYFYEVLMDARSPVTVSGISILSRPAQIGLERFARSVLIALPRNFKSYRDITRYPMYMAQDELPVIVKQLLKVDPLHGSALEGQNKS